MVEKLMGTEHVGSCGFYVNILCIFFLFCCAECEYEFHLHNKNCIYLVPSPKTMKPIHAYADLFKL